jgi:succinyl-diaminopimelate desuccinylase
MITAPGATRAGAPFTIEGYTMGKPTARDAVLRAVDSAREEIVALAQALIRIPTVNPPGDAYEPCARLLGDTLHSQGYEVSYYTATDRPEHSARYPRVNVVGRRRGTSDHPCVHFNGHLDVVPAGAGWSTDPFGGEVRGGRLYGRGASDMKAGLAAAVLAAECVRRAGVTLAGTVEVSGTVDEESGGWAGVAHLAQVGRLTSRTADFVIIPEPLGVDRICIGHRGVYWFAVEAHGRIAHGSMPFLGVNAIAAMGELLHAIDRELQPVLAGRRTPVPVVPDGARHATLNINSITGGQGDSDVQSPCVAHHCRAVFDRRYLPEESFGEVRAEVEALLERAARQTPGGHFTLHDLMHVAPVRTPEGSPLVQVLSRGIAEVRGRDATLVASPGTYDHKHVARLGGIEQCVAYGPGRLELSHQPDEWCDVDELVRATQVMALALLDLAGGVR